MGSTGSLGSGLPVLLIFLIEVPDADLSPPALDTRDEPPRSTSSSVLACKTHKPRVGGLNLSCLNQGKESPSANPEARASLLILKLCVDLLRQFNPKIKKQDQS